MCPPSSCQAGRRLRKVIRNPNHAAYNIGDIINSFPITCLPTKRIVASISMLECTSTSPELERVSACTLGINGERYAPYVETIIAIINPAIGPEIPTSNNVSLFIIKLRDIISAPNVGNPKTGIPGIKYGQLILSLCIFEATM